MHRSPFEDREDVSACWGVAVKATVFMAGLIALALLVQDRPGGAASPEPAPQASPSGG